MGVVTAAGDGVAVFSDFDQAFTAVVAVLPVRLCAGWSCLPGIRSGCFPGWLCGVSLGIRYAFPRKPWERGIIAFLLHLTGDPEDFRLLTLADLSQSSGNHLPAHLECLHHPKRQKDVTMYQSTPV